MDLNVDFKDKPNSPLPDKIDVAMSFMTVLSWPEASAKLGAESASL